MAMIRFMSDNAPNLEIRNNGLHAYTESSISLGTRRALLVGDKNPDLMTLTSMLQQFGFDVAESGNALAGAKRFHDGEQYHVVFINRYMPIMNGLQATSLLRKKGIISKIVGISYNEACKEEFLDAGADTFHIMPLERPSLAGVLEALGLIN